MSYNSISGPFDTPTCPYCRQRMTMLLLYFSESERNSAELEMVDGRNQIISTVRSYNRRFTGKFLVCNRRRET